MKIVVIICAEHLYFWNLQKHLLILSHDLRLRQSKQPDLDPVILLMKTFFRRDALSHLCALRTDSLIM